MADQLRLILIILGALFLGALLVHGLWSARKKNTPKHRYYDNAEQESAKKETADGFDEYGIGRVRVISSTGTKKSSSVADDNETETETAEQQYEKNNDLQKTFDFDDQDEPQLNISALPDEEDTVAENKAAAVAEKSSGKNTAEEPAEVLILYVLLPENKEINGQNLLSSLLTLGFKYGEMNIFHRHVDSAGAGDVLFSLANMFNPGTFDIENMEKLATRGVSLFMQLPGAGEPLQNFNLMHNAAKKLAEEFGGQVLDGQRSVLTVQTVRHYVDKIREHQRQQLIRG